MDLDVLTDAIDRLCGSDPLACADGESIEILHRQLARLESFVTNATAAFDAAENWVPDGAQGPAGWLAVRCRLPKSRARAMLRRGRSLRHLPECARAWAGGDITAAQVDVIAGLRSDATAEALARDEEMLVGQASTMRYSSFTRAAAYWKHFADPDGVEADDEKRRKARDVYLESSFGGMWLGKMTLDPISGSIVGTELERLEKAPVRGGMGGGTRGPRTRAHLPGPAPGPRANVEPTPWSRWRRGVRWLRATGAAPPRCSAS